MTCGKRHLHLALTDLSLEELELCGAVRVEIKNAGARMSRSPLQDMQTEGRLYFIVFIFFCLNWVSHRGAVVYLNPFKNPFHFIPKI